MKINNETDMKIASLIKEGGVITEYKSLWELKTGNSTFKYFSGNETAVVKPFAKYNFTGKNPADSKEAVIVAFGFEATAAGEAIIDLSAPTNNYAVHTSLSKLLNQAFYTIKQNKTVMREGFVAKIHQPLPRVLKPFLRGSVTDAFTSVAVGDVLGANLENKNEKHALYLPINLKSDGEVLDIQVTLPSGGFTIDATLDGYILALHAIAVEFPNGRMKREIRKAPTQK